MWSTIPPHLPGYAFASCNHPRARPIHEVGCTAISKDSLALWAIESSNADARSTVRHLLANDLEIADPAKILRRANDLVCKSNSDEVSRVVGLMLIVIHGAHNKFSVSSSMDCFSMVRTPGRCAREFNRNQFGVPLGMLPEYDYEVQTFDLAPNTVVFWLSPYTTQIGNSSSELYGSGRAQEKLNTATSGPSDLVQTMSTDILGFVGNNDQGEDICMICFQRIG